MLYNVCLKCLIWSKIEEIGTIFSEKFLYLKKFPYEPHTPSLTPYQSTREYPKILKIWIFIRNFKKKKR
jgi:hypothetical protein